VRWHATGLSVFQQCPEKFRRRYVEGERDEFLSASSMIGRALHAAAQRGAEARTEGQAINPDFAVEYAVAHFDGLVEVDAAGDQPIPWDETPGSLEDRRADVEELVRLWVKNAPTFWADYGEPVMIEQHFDVELNGHEVSGQMDCVTDRDVIIDWKSGKRPMSLSKAEREMQQFVYPAAYQAMTGRWPTKMVFVQLVRHKPTKTKPKWRYSLNIQEREVDEAQRELLMTMLDGYSAQHEAGVYPLNITSSLCSPDWCPFWSTCPAHLLKPLAEREAEAEAETDTVEEAVEGD
jgi:hypothetical protein